MDPLALPCRKIRASLNLVNLGSKQYMTSCSFACLCYVDKYEDGSQDAVSIGEGLGTSGICHLFQAGNGPHHPFGASMACLRNVQPPGSGCKCSRHSPWLCGCRHQRHATRAGSHR